MLIKLILITAIVGISLPLMKSRVSERNTAVRRMGIVVFALLAIVSVIFPALTSHVARMVGVHRGTDLLLYLLTIAFLASLMTASKQRSKLDHKITQVARAQALTSVITPPASPDQAESPTETRAPTRADPGAADPKAQPNDAHSPRPNGE